MDGGRGEAVFAIEGQTNAEILRLSESLRVLRG